MAIEPIGVASLVPAGSSISPVPQKQPAEVPFGKMIDHLLRDANSQQVQADQTVRQFAMGESDNLHDVMLAVAKADLSFRLVLEVRNRLVEAYQEIMRMQI